MTVPESVVTIPIFPLPQAVLFDGNLLPLHIFEPRYRQMVTEVLDKRGWIGMALLKPGWQEDYYGRPPLFETLGIGEIMYHQKENDGRYNLLLMGIGRARIVHLVDDRPYRMGECKFDLETCSFSAQECKALLPYLKKAVSENRDPSDNIFTTNMNTFSVGKQCEIHVNTLTSLLIANPLDKQRMLEMPSIEARIQELVSLHKLPDLRAQLREMRP